MTLIIHFKSTLKCHLQFLSIWTSLKLSSAISFNFDQFKILLSGNRLNTIQRYRQLLKTCWDKEKVLVSSIFSFSHIFYPVRDRNRHFCKIRFVAYKCFQLDQAKSVVWLTHYHALPHFDALKIYISGIHCEKRRNC